MSTLLRIASPVIPTAHDLRHHIHDILVYLAYAGWLLVIVGGMSWKKWKKLLAWLRHHRRPVFPPINGWPIKIPGNPRTIPIPKPPVHRI